MGQMDANFSFDTNDVPQLVTLILSEDTSLPVSKWFSVRPRLVFDSKFDHLWRDHVHRLASCFCACSHAVLQLTVTLLVYQRKYFTFFQLVIMIGTWIQFSWLNKLKNSSGKWPFKSRPKKLFLVCHKNSKERLVFFQTNDITKINVLDLTWLT